MNPFTITQPLPDIFHVQDATNVCFTLIRGERDTLLWDTGVGLYDVAECVAPYVRGKLHVVLSHAHYDHVCGQHYFPESFVHPVDFKRCQRCVGRQNRTGILKRIRERGLVEDQYPAERFMNGTPETVKPLPDMTLHLGNLEVRFLLTPGHTPGSIVAYLPQRKLLLTGDMWNPHTWLFFPESRPLSVYVKAMKGLYDLDVVHVLRPHDPALDTMDRLRAYIDGLNERTFAAAQPCPIPPYTRFNTWCCYPEPNSKLVFNADKRS
jgi:glyoxylase-like metal-dependent hydrolase (beta-lactamase superfamily II)